MAQFVSGTRATVLELDNDYGLVSVNGAIFGGLVSVAMDGVESSLRNAGVVDGILGVLVRNTAGTARIDNSGSIAGIQVSFSGQFAPRLELVNTGDITKANASAILVYSSASIVNTGNILSSGGTTVAFLNTNLGSQITNDGTIGNAQGAVAISFGGGNDYLQNSGRILGDVQGGAGNDIFDLRNGYVSGTVLGGTGDDRYTVNAPGVALAEGFAAGNDTVVAACDLVLEANIETLTLRGAAREGIGNGTANTLNGNLRDNLLGGRAGDDSLFGFAGDDDLFGHAGNDSLIGGEGDDQLIGGLGNDLLDGQSGADRMVGGAGADTFRFFSFEDGLRDAPDVIVDFVRGVDDLDLSGIDANLGVGGNQSFQFIGSAAFTAVGQARVVVGTNQVLLELNMESSPSAEATIVLRGLTALTAGDLIL